VVLPVDLTTIMPMVILLVNPAAQPVLRANDLSGFVARDP
jgi:hypothetical protein